MSSKQPEVEITSTMAELRDFLERLGTSVEIPKEGRVVSRIRTALGGEQTREFNVVSDPQQRLLKRTPNILADGVELPDDVEEYDQVQYFRDFLDQSVQAPQIATGILRDKELQRQRESFIPQKIHRNGLPSDHDSIQVFQSWMRDRARNLLAVLAPAGYGKTALTGEAACLLAENYLEREPNGAEPFPLRINFGEYRLASDFEAMVLKALHRNNVVDVPANAFAYLVDKQRAVLILDGFDELLENRPDEAKQNLRELIETLGSTGKVIITARSTFFRTSEQVADFLEYGVKEDAVDVIELQPFGESQKKKLIAKKCETQDEIRRIGTFVNSPSLAEPLGSPLLLNQTIELLQDEDEAARLDRQEGRRNLFGALESSVYERERKRQGHEFTNEEQRRFLTALAEEMFKENEPGYDAEATEYVATVALEQLGVEADEADIKSLIDHHFLNVAESELAPAERPIYFNHQVYREYFQALALVGSVSEAEADLAEIFVRRPLPEEVAKWFAEFDPKQEIADYVVDLVISDGPVAQQTLANCASLCAAYGNPRLLEKALASVPPETSLDLVLTGLDLQSLDLGGHYFNSLECTKCNLTNSLIRDTVINELTLDECEIVGLDCRDSLIESAVFDYGSRDFDSANILRELASRGALTEVEDEAQIAELEEKRGDQIREILHSRIGRFYVKGGHDSGAGAKWKNEIVEMNLYGGLVNVKRKWAKRTVVPALLKEGVLERRRVNADWRYRVAEDAEDDARAFIESDKARGKMKAALNRLEKKEA